MSFGSSCFWVTGFLPQQVLYSTARGLTIRAWLCMLVGTTARERAGNMSCKLKLFSLFDEATEHEVIGPVNASKNKPTIFYFTS